ncbi:hypothetical protein [Synechococcus sp. PCC 6312]|uniref:hypothetical protein n=1 Tax=Synechococcus sp. (strain ATCC 27167 / PCC 6312) TaxID=195253 RepID=UPI0020A055A9|nr:hypothetical protein [Synechococcus sp. PCC 6312]
MTSKAQPNSQPAEAEEPAVITTDDDGGGGEVAPPTLDEPESPPPTPTSPGSTTRPAQPSTRPVNIPVPSGVRPSTTTMPSGGTIPARTPVAAPRLPENPFQGGQTAASMEEVLRFQFNNDLWQGILGGLPCLDSTQECVKRLQELAIARSPILKEVDARIEEANTRIQEAQSNNQKLVNLEVFTPALQSYLSFDAGPSARLGTTQVVTDPFTGRQTTVTTSGPTAESPFDKIGRLFTGTGIAEALSLIGIPLITNLFGGSQAAATRSLAIGDLQIKVAELQRNRAELAGRIRDKVTLDVLAFDQFKREFQATQELARREQTRLKLYEVTYRYGAGSTDQYLSRVNQADQYTSNAFKAWAAMRKNLEQIKILTTGENQLNPDAQLRPAEEAL